MINDEEILRFFKNIIFFSKIFMKVTKSDYGQDLKIIILMENKEPVDLTAFKKYFPKVEAKEGEVGYVYNADIPEETYHKLTYTINQPQVQYVRTQPIITKEIDSTTDSVSHPRNTYNKKKNLSTSSSPYDFRQSCEIPIESKSLATFDSQLQNVIYKEAPVCTDLKFVGKSAVFNSKYVGIRSSIKRPMPSTSLEDESPIDEDPVIKEIAQKPSEQKLRVFATAKALAALAVCPRSVYPFDLKFEKTSKDVYVKTRPGNKSAVLETNLETFMTTVQVQRDKMTLEFTNNVIETTEVNQSFVKMSTEGQTPIEIGEEVQGINGPFVYRSIIVNEIEFIVRGQIDALKEPTKQGERPSICLCRVFNDIPTTLRKNPWDKLDTKRGAIFLGEINSNSAKVARWIANAKLIGAETCMIGYAVRKTPLTKDQHLLLGVEKHGTEKIARDISLFNQNLYGILNEIFTRVEDFSDGTYIFVRESKQKKTYSIYQNVEAPAASK